MRSMLLAAAALAAIATPAAARDNSAYFGLEVGGLQVKDTDVEVEGEDFGSIDHKLGVDGDMIAGYDFGMFRLEAELGYKRSHHKEYQLTDEGDELFEVDADGRSSTYSLMLNGMVDVGNERDINFYAGAGAGYAQVIHALRDDEDRIKIKDRGFAWQLFAGVRKQLDRHFDVGLKYRYFDGGDVDDSFDGDGISTDYKSHSLLVSLIHNFNVEPAAYVPPPMALPPPPPPEPLPEPLPPATQTCPDGSVVLATEPCPALPPPPPPPPPLPERG